MRNRLGQSTAEYATLLVIIIGAITVMQVFLKRGQNAAIRDAVVTHYLNSGTGTNGLAGTVQFEPYYQRSHMQTSVSSSGQAYVRSGGRYHHNSYTSYNVDSSSYKNQLAFNNYRNESDWGWNQKLGDLGL